MKRIAAALALLLPILSPGLCSFAIDNATTVNPGEPGSSLEPDGSEPPAPENKERPRVKIYRAAPLPPYTATGPSLFKVHMGMPDVIAENRIPGLTITDGEGYVGKHQVDGMDFSILLQSLDGNVESIYATFKEDHFEKVLSSLMSKYGEGSIKTSVIQNRMGASFEQIVVTWTFKGKSILSVDRYASTLDESSVDLVSYKSIKAFEEAQRKALKTPIDGL